MHGEGLTGACLAVGEEGHVVAIDGRLHQVFAIFEDLDLSAGQEHGIEGVLCATSRLGLDGQVHGVDTLSDLGVARLLLLLAQRPNAAEHADGTLEVLDGVMQLLPSALRVLQVRLGDASCERACNRRRELLLRLPHGIDVGHVGTLGVAERLLNGLEKLRLLLLPLEQGVRIPVLVLRERGLLRRNHGLLEGLDRALLERLLEQLPGLCLGQLLLENSFGLLDDVLFNASLLGLLNGEFQLLYLFLLDGALEHGLGLFLRLGGVQEFPVLVQLRLGQADLLALRQRGLHGLRVARLLRGGQPVAGLLPGLLDGEDLPRLVEPRRVDLALLRLGQGLLDLGGVPGGHRLG
mmetsp:Transcript_2911/g.7297  ORF Transcript_2911/g.7297 Transcript_2911/m.7297 type:complete len:350 (+) Transcript_2911:866-1915(+)